MKSLIFDGSRETFNVFTIARHLFLTRGWHIRSKAPSSSFKVKLEYMTLCYTGEYPRRQQEAQNIQQKNSYLEFNEWSDHVTNFFPNKWRARAADSTKRQNNYFFKQKYHLRHSVMLRRLHWYCVTDASGKLIGPRLKGEMVWDDSKNPPMAKRFLNYCIQFKKNSINMCLLSVRGGHFY